MQVQALGRHGRVGHQHRAVLEQVARVRRPDHPPLARTVGQPGARAGQHHQGGGQIKIRGKRAHGRGLTLRRGETNGELRDHAPSTVKSPLSRGFYGVWTALLPFTRANRPHRLELRPRVPVGPHPRVGDRLAGLEDQSHVLGRAAEVPVCAPGVAGLVVAAGGVVGDPGVAGRAAGTRVWRVRARPSSVPACLYCGPRRRCGRCGDGPGAARRGSTGGTEC